MLFGCLTDPLQSVNGRLWGSWQPCLFVGWLVGWLICRSVGQSACPTCRNQNMTNARYKMMILMTILLVYPSKYST